MDKIITLRISGSAKTFLESLEINEREAIAKGLRLLQYASEEKLILRSKNGSIENRLSEEKILKVQLKKKG